MSEENQNSWDWDAVAEEADENTRKFNREKLNTEVDRYLHEGEDMAKKKKSKRPSGRKPSAKKKQSSAKKRPSKRVKSMKPAEPGPRRMGDETRAHFKDKLLQGTPKNNELYGPTNEELGYTSSSPGNGSMGPDIVATSSPLEAKAESEKPAGFKEVSKAAADMNSTAVETGQESYLNPGGIKVNPKVLASDESDDVFDIEERAEGAGVSESQLAETAARLEPLIDDHKPLKPGQSKEVVDNNFTMGIEISSDDEEVKSLAKPAEKSLENTLADTAEKPASKKLIPAKKDGPYIAPPVKDGKTEATPVPSGAVPKIDVSDVKPAKKQVKPTDLTAPVTYNKSVRDEQAAGEFEVPEQVKRPSERLVPPPKLEPIDSDVDPADPDLEEKLKAKLRESDKHLDFSHLPDKTKQGKEKTDREAAAKRALERKKKRESARREIVQSAKDMESRVAQATGAFEALQAKTKGEEVYSREQVVSALKKARAEEWKKADAHYRKEITSAKAEVEKAKQTAIEAKTAGARGEQHELEKLRNELQRLGIEDVKGGTVDEVMKNIDRRVALVAQQKNQGNGNNDNNPPKGYFARAVSAMYGDGKKGLIYLVGAAALVVAGAYVQQNFLEKEEKSVPVETTHNDEDTAYDGSLEGSVLTELKEGTGSDGLEDVVVPDIEDPGYEPVVPSVEGETPEPYLEPEDSSGEGYGSGKPKEGDHGEKQYDNGKPKNGSSGNKEQETEPTPEVDGATPQVEPASGDTAKPKSFEERNTLHKAPWEGVPLHERSYTTPNKSAGPDKNYAAPPKSSNPDV